jgi:hypothetical protein
LGAILAGGLGGQMLVAWLDPRGQADLDVIGIVVGAGLAVGIYRSLRR